MGLHVGSTRTQQGQTRSANHAPSLKQQQFELNTHKPKKSPKPKPNNPSIG